MKWPILLRRKPTTIRAMRWTGDNYSDLKAWGASVYLDTTRGVLVLWVAANNASLDLEEGEWIAHDEIGYYPIKDEMIKRNYDEVTDA